MANATSSYFDAVAWLNVSGLLRISGFNFNFADADRSAEARLRAYAGGMQTFFRKRYLALFLDSLELRNFQDSSGMWQRRTPMWICKYPWQVMMREHYRPLVVYILREASAAVRSTNPGNAKASTSGTGSRYGPRAFCL